jgi:two-component system nitrogen regulation sensor histidine kinase NtrY
MRAPERKRRRRELIAALVAGCTLIAFVFAQAELPALSRHTSLTSNLAVIALFNLSFILAGLMLFLVARNLAKVIFERRRGLIGSKLQSRLVTAFIAVALVPTLFLLVVSSVFLRADIDNWFNPEYQKVLDDSVEIVHTYYLNSANNAMHYARGLAEEIAEQGLVVPAKRAALKKLVDKTQQEFNFGTIEVFGPDRKLLDLSLSPKTPTGIGVGPASALLADTLKGIALSRTDRIGESDVIRGSAPIFASSESDQVIGAVVVDYYLPRSLTNRATDVSRVSEDYFQLKILRQPIINSYIIALVLIGLVVVTLASWFGIYLARGITGPIKLLAQGTQAVAAGNLSHRIRQVGDDEIGHLIDSFNRMTDDLRQSGEELERRRRYTEMLLRNVSAGVVGIDREGRVTSVNPCAERLLGAVAGAAIGSHFREAFAPAVVRSLDDLLASASRPREARATIRSDSGAGTELMVAASPLGEGPDDSAGTVLFFEDASQVAKVERMEAWREVARRIAHEIKNPLTPIQLSAERMRRQIGARGGPESALVEECTRTIIGEVEDLKRLVNEFSSFARMPQINPVPGDINAVAAETVANFREAHPAVEFETTLDSTLPSVSIDREAIKRALVNLIDNAVAATTASASNGDRPRIAVSTAISPDGKTVTIEVCDNGPGIEPRLRTRIFEPYFSGRKGGTGLGLAIVSAVVTDHHGLIRVVDNLPHGSRFIMEFPLQNRGFARAAV